MTLDQISAKLHHLRFAGKWSIRGLARETALSQSTIAAAMAGKIGRQTQTRLTHLLPLVPLKAPVRKLPPSKHKPGRFKRYLIRYYNLMGWLDVIEQEREIRKKFFRKKQGHMSRERAAFICHKLDFQMKTHLLAIYGDKLRLKRIVMADCYPAEKWIERIHKLFPHDRVALFKKLMKRGK